MNHYERAVDEIPKLERVIDNIFHATGRNGSGEPDSRNDKHTFTFSNQVNRNAPKIVEWANWPAAEILLRMSYGYYGSSSGYSCVDEATAKCVMVAMNRLAGRIAEEAITVAREGIDELRKCAAGEAQKVLAEMKS